MCFEHVSGSQSNTSVLCGWGVTVMDGAIVRGVTSEGVRPTVCRHKDLVRVCVRRVWEVPRGTPRGGRVTGNAATS